MDGRRRNGPPIATPLAIAVVSTAAIISATMPLTGTPGPESAQILSAIGGPALLLAAAARGAQRSNRGFFGDLLQQSLLVVASLAIFVIVSTVSKFANTSCAPGRGYLPFVLVAAPTLLLNSAIGLWIGRLLSKPRLAVAAAFGFWATYVVWLLLDWHWEPSFRVITHLLVLLEGDMLQGRAVSPAAVAFRVSTLCFAIVLCLQGVLRYPRNQRGGLSSSGGGSPMLHLASAGLALLALVIQSQATDELSPGRDALESRYTMKREHGPLVVHADPTVTTVDEADAILAEGTLWLGRLQQRLQVKPTDKLHVWLHRDNRVLGHYTGAEHVHFALPGHGEIHISGVQIPHPTLGHELAHLLGRQLNEGMLGVPTQFGLLPSAGIIEGFAMALTPELELDYGLTLREKAAALRRAGLAPELNALFGEYLSFFGFWRQPPGNAYVTAGAVVEAVIASAGLEGLAKLYSTGSLEAVFPDSDALERFLKEHERSLDAMELPSFAVSQVSRTYNRPSILDQTCDPDAVEDAKRVLGAAQAGNFEQAEALARQREGKTLAAKTLQTLATTATELGKDDLALRYVLASADETDLQDPREQADRFSRAGDALWRHGRRREALAHWEKTQTQVLHPGHQRLVKAKRFLASELIAVPNPNGIGEAAMDLLVGRDDGDMTTSLMRLTIAVARATEASEPESVRAFGQYLLARQFVQHGALDDGIEYFLMALEPETALQEPFREQALRGIALGHAKRGDFNIARVGFAQLSSASGDAAPRVRMRDRQERVERMAMPPDGPEATPGNRWLLGLPVSALEL